MRRLSQVFSVKTTLHSLQHLVYEIACAAAIPVIVGTNLGLTSQEIASLVLRIFFLVGITSLIQAFWGHRYPIAEGPAGIWYSTVIVLAGTAVLTGKPLSLLRTDLETGLIAAGILSIFLGSFRLMPYLSKLCTPVVNGTFLIVLSLQFSTVITKGLLKTNDFGSPVISVEKVSIFLITLAITLLLSLKLKGFIQSIAVLLGTAIGWGIAFLYGMAPHVSSIAQPNLPFFAIPKIWAWGTPTFDIGVTLTSMVTALVILSMMIASVSGMDNLHGRPERPSTYNRTVICLGISDILTAFGSAVGFVPYTSSIGFATLTGVLELTPFIVGNILLIILGLIPAVGVFFAAMPIIVGYAVLFSVFVVICGLGIKECFRNGLDKTQMIILGLSIMMGNGIIFIPAQAFVTIPSTITYLISNGVVVSVCLALLLEQVIFRGKEARP